MIRAVVLTEEGQSSFSVDVILLCYSYQTKVGLVHKKEEWPVQSEYDNYNILLISYVLEAMH